MLTRTSPGKTLGPGWFDAILLAAAAALYAPTLANGFVGDDLIYFVRNAHITGFHAGTILRSGAIGADYAPLRDLSFAFDYRVWGGNPFGFHLTNLVLFGAMALLLRRLFERLSAFLEKRKAAMSPWPAFLAALLFAVHPNNREVVYAIYNRGALLTALFAILTCLQFLEHLRRDDRPRGPYAAALFFHLCLLMSREYGITVPLVLVLLVWFAGTGRRSRGIIATVPFFILSAVFFAVHMAYAARAGFLAPAISDSRSGLATAAIAAKICLFYIVRMATSLGRFEFSGSLPFGVAALAILAALGYTACRMRGRHPQVLFGLLFYLVCLIPVLNVFGTSPVVSPRYGFLPCLGLFFIVTALPLRQGKQLLPAGIVLAVLAWNIFTMHKTDYWKDNVAYWEFIASRDKGWFSAAQLGYAYYEKRSFDKAVEVMQRVEPMLEKQKFHFVLGDACLQLGDYRCASDHLSRAKAPGEPGDPARRPGADPTVPKTAPGLPYAKTAALQ